MKNEKGLLLDPQTPEQLARNRFNRRKVFIATVQSKVELSVQELAETCGLSEAEVERALKEIAYGRNT